MRRYLAGLALLVLWAPANAQTLAPVDEALKREDFLAFRTALREIVARRDSAGLFRVVDPAIKNSFSGDDGREAFRRHWRPEDPGSALWPELAAILVLGGTFDGPDTFVAPYVFSRWPDGLDSFEHVAVVGSGVRVRVAPSTRGRILAKLSYRLLRRGKPTPGRGNAWTPVVLPDGRSGFIASHLVRSPVDYRTYFRRVNGEWTMIVLVAGD